MSLLYATSSSHRESKDHKPFPCAVRISDPLVVGDVYKERIWWKIPDNIDLLSLVDEKTEVILRKEDKVFIVECYDGYRE